MMRTKKYAVLSAFLLAAVLTGCDAQGEVTETQPVQTTAVTAQPVTEPKDREFIVEPNAIEGLKLVERVYPLGTKYLMIGLNEFDGRSAVLYDAKTNTAEPKTLKRLSEAGDILEVVMGAEDTVHVFYAYGENGDERYVETYDSTLTLTDECAMEDMLTLDETTGESVDYPSMQVDADGNSYFLGFDIAGNHQVMVFDKEKQYLGSVRGDMRIGDELIRAADGKVYLMYYGDAQQIMMASVDPSAMTLNTIKTENVPAYHSDVITGTNGYDFYFQAQEAIYGIHAAEGTSEVVIDWGSTVFDGNQVHGFYSLPDGSYLVSNTASSGMDAGTWKMVVKG
ncbi:MAG: hypothetical protein II341_07630 [Oscillospiraceae bacterium]|nr:hypothetical protein [Oscillospiraceae bacterium]